MDLEQKLNLLMSLAADDHDGAPLPPRLRHARSTGALNPVNIRNLRPMPGSRMRLLRILMTNACTFNCHYCPMRRDRELPRTLLKPEEMVRIFLGALQRGWCDGRNGPPVWQGNPPADRRWQSGPPRAARYPDPFHVLFAG